MNLKLHTYFFSILFFIGLVPYSVFGQKDSIERLVKNEKSISAKIRLLQKASESQSAEALYFSRKAYQLALSEMDNKLIGNTANHLSYTFFLKEILDSAQYYQKISLDAFTEIGDDEGLYDVLTNKETYLRFKNDFKGAFEVNKQLIDIAEKLNSNDKLANVYKKMGYLFRKLNDIEKSITYFNKALKVYQQSENLEGVESCYLNLGDCNSSKGYYDLAIEYFERGLDINKQTNDYNKKSAFLSGIAGIYYDLSNYEKALYYYQEALAVKKQYEPQSFDADLNNNIGTVLMEMGRFKDAKPYLIQVYFDARNKKEKSQLALISSFNLSQLYEDLGDYKTAMEYMNSYVNMSDSLSTVENAKNLSEIEAKYQNEKKEEQNILLNERLKNKSLQIYFAMAAIALLLVLAYFIYRGSVQKQKANQELAIKNKIIEEKSQLVEEQHKDITDSIKYAQRIQQAVLPPYEMWRTILPDSFVFYQPKDILSGDFYWIAETEQHIFVAAADCTGHGVPGALMSIVNYNLLNKAVLEKGITDAGAILDNVNHWLTESLHQTFQESTVRDGMDVSLCVIDKTTKQLNYAGAFNSIYIVSQQGVSELLPDKQPVGTFIEDNIKSFKNNYRTLQDGDVVYMFTDGYADQFGGPNGKKFKYKNMQAMLQEIHQKDMSDQKDIIKKTINDWKGNLEQIDDMLLLGFRIG